MPQVLRSLAAALDACPGTTALPSEPLPEREGDRKPRRAESSGGTWDSRAAFGQRRHDGFSVAVPGVAVVFLPF